jgi:hypothetical protein
MQRWVECVESAANPYVCLDIKMTKLAVEHKSFQKLFESIASADLNVMEMSNPCPLCWVHWLACL